MQRPPPFPGARHVFFSPSRLPLYRFLSSLNPRSDLPSNLGRTRLDRLLHIGRSSVPLCVDALKAAIAEAKKMEDVAAYERAWDCLSRAAPDDPDAALDSDWVAKTKRANADTLAQLELDQASYKNNLIKESIRV